MQDMSASVWVVVDPDLSPVCAFDDSAGRKSADEFCDELKSLGAFGCYSAHDVSKFDVVGPIDLYGDDVVQAVDEVVAKEKARESEESMWEDEW